jgi:hypothetical protein
MDTAQGLDGTARVNGPVVEESGKGVLIRLPLESSRWARKQVLLQCEEDHLALSAEVDGRGDLTDCHLLGGFLAGGGRWPSGFGRSGPGFASVFNPEPSRTEVRAVPASSGTAIDVLGTALPGRRHWFFTPPPFCFGMSRMLPEAGDLPAGPWMMAGLLVRPGEHTFTRFAYDGADDAFAFRLSYEGQTRIDGRWRSPEICFLFDASDPYDGLERYVALLELRGLVPGPRTAARPAWWRRPIFCGWGAQSHLAAAAGGAPQDYATQESYDAFLHSLAQRGLQPGSVIIDDKWQSAYGLSRPDPAKWSDLRGWIARRHGAGQRVLLWWKAWDPEGLAPRLCVRDHLGNAVATDPSNPEYEAVLRNSIRQLLAADGLDADGLKVDFTGSTPSGPGLTRYGDAWGVELLHRLLSIVAEEARRAKPDALLITHTPNPYFRRQADMIRLNDLNPEHPVIPQMRHRTGVARAACPELLIDTDNWQMPDKASWRRYLAVQAELGVPSLYYATHVDRTSEPLEDDDYAAIAETWEKAG